MDEQAIVQEVDRALAVDHSPEFLARVRARVASEPAPREWKPLAALAMVASVAALAVLMTVARSDREGAPAEMVRAQIRAADVATHQREPQSAAPSVTTDLPRRSRAMPPMAAKGHARAEQLVALSVSPPAHESGSPHEVEPMEELLLEPKLTTELQPPADAAKWLQMDPAIHIITISQGARQ